jgi:hypothetical protein
MSKENIKELIKEYREAVKEFNNNKSKQYLLGYMLGLKNAIYILCLEDYIGDSSNTLSEVKGELNMIECTIKDRGINEIQAV